MKKCRFAAALAALLIAAVPFVSHTVRAESDDYSQTVSSVQIKKYLVMKKGVSVPDVSFGYTLTSGQAVEGTETTHEIKAGPPGAVFVSSDDVSVSGNKATLRFGPSDAAAAESSAPSGSTIQFATAGNKDDEAFAEKTLTVDFSGVTFPSEGIYRYVVRETPSGVSGITSDSAAARYIDVFVHKSDQTDEDTYDAGSVTIRLNDGAPDADGKADAAIKSTGFTNRYNTNNLRFAKTVTGNQASFNQYFKFTVKLTGRQSAGENNTRVKVGGTFDPNPTENMATVYDADVMAQANSGVEYVTLSQLRAGKDFYIKNDQSVLLTGIPEGMGYVVTEAKEDYTPSVEADGDMECTLADSKVTDSSLTKDTVLDFLNTRNGIIPVTGVSVAFAVPAAVMLAGAAGLALLVAKRIRGMKRNASEGNGIE